jgi:phenylalanyl-tRNA synthetase beta chain
MRISENWLREWVNPSVNTNELAEKLTMAGLEVDSVQPVSGEFSDVVVGQVLSAEPHPNANKLTICEVGIGEEASLTIICGAPNARKGIVVAVAKVGAVLPSGLKIKKAKLRGEPSFGMLCSEDELGLEKSIEGIMELPEDAPLGESLRTYLELDDSVIEVDLTPNRGDCLSMKGVGREVAALYSLELNNLDNTPIKIESDETLSVELEGQAVCAHYCGRVISGLDMSTPTPIWMVERLRRAGLRQHSLVVDVTNYVMIELGQPMHAFDLDKIDEKIVVRMAKKGETLVLLDEQTVSLKEDTLVIADKSKPLAIAGVMGGLESSVTDKTRTIFLESAYFSKSKMAGVARAYNLATDSSHRFERGVAIALQLEGLERATSLLLSLAGGQAGPIIDVENKTTLPALISVPFNLEKSNKVLGLALDEKEVLDYFKRLGMTVEEGESWTVSIPPYRFDISIEADLIEEVARLYGYDAIPPCPLVSTMKIETRAETAREEDDLRQTLVSLGYHEAISYSFVCPKRHALVYDVKSPIDLVNPISDELTEMRQGLWVGLLDAAKYNQARQQAHFKLFETGLCFENINSELSQKNTIAGLMVGKIGEEDWSKTTRMSDFYDIKGDVEALLGNRVEEYVFRAPLIPHKALHPGMSAAVFLEDVCVGHVGVLHPSLAKKWDLSGTVLLFELNVDDISKEALPAYTRLSKFPSIKRDIAVVVDEKISLGEILSFVEQEIKESLIKSIRVFDVYQGDNIEIGKKSIALGLILQHPSRTLVDSEVNDVIGAIIQILGKQFDITLRD